MLFDIYLYDGNTLEDIEGAVDPTGITYQKTSGIIIPGEEDYMNMVLIPWASISKLEYVITPEMVQAQNAAAYAQANPQPIMGDDGTPVQLNRAQRRAAARG